MYKAFVLVLLVFIGCASARTRTLNVKKTNPIERVLPVKQDTNALDWCPQCIDTYDYLVEAVIDVILQYGILDTCGHLCTLVANKTGSDFVGFVCMFGCDVLGIEEFVKIMDKADIDPIYYCEEIHLCPVNDNGDAKIQSFLILPARGPEGTKFGLDYVYVTKNGTGTGEIIVTVNTVDKIPLSAGFLNEAQKPGTYGERLVLDASPNPDCDPTQGQCEEWLPGIYNVTVIICNGQCGSHHPHTQVYDIAHSSFQITEE